MNHKDQQIKKILDIDTMINDYIGKKKHTEQLKPKTSLHKPLLVFDLNFKQKKTTILQKAPDNNNIKKSGHKQYLSFQKLKSKTILVKEDYQLEKKNISKEIQKNNVPKISCKRVQSAKFNNKFFLKTQTNQINQRKNTFNTLSKKKINTTGMLKNRYKLENIIGRGSFSVVYKAKDILTNKYIAIKILTTKQSPQSALYKYLDHPYIIKILNMFEYEGKIHLVFQYFPKTLLVFLRQNRQNLIIVKTLFKQICKAVQYIHMMGIVHRDIKLENILVQQKNNQYSYDLTESFCVKIIDFGLAVRIQNMDGSGNNNNNFKDFCGTPNYVAPQILNKQLYEGKPTDCWALGIILYLMLVGRFPFKSKQQGQLYKKIKKGKIFFPDNISQKGKRLILNLLKPDPSQRFSIHDILIDNWFQ